MIDYSGALPLPPMPLVSKKAMSFAHRAECLRRTTRPQILKGIGGVGETHERVIEATTPVSGSGSEERAEDRDQVS